MSKKKYLGIFYKSVWLQIHYIPSVIIAVLLTQLLAHLFGIHEFHKWYIIAIQFIVIYIGVSLTDQITHAFGDLLNLPE